MPVKMHAGIHGEPVSVPGHTILSRALVTISNQLWTLKNKRRGRHVNLRGVTTTLESILVLLELFWKILEKYCYISILVVFPFIYGILFLLVAFCCE